jgi:hypothetical protein
MNDTKHLFCILALILAGVPLAPALGSTADPLALQIKHCASLTVASARLACYDALAGSAGLNQASAPAPAASSNAAKAGAGTLAPGAPPAPAETQFGVHNGALEAKLVSPQREKRMLAVVRAVSNRPRGELMVTLDNGQVWVQLQASTYPVKPGDHVEIDVGALGSYVLWCPSIRRATKVTRIS